MADDIRKTIPQLNAGGVVSGSLFESAQPAQTSTGYASVKVTSDDIATYTNATKSYSALNTSAKQIIPAINEAASMGGVVQLTQAEYTALLPIEKMNGSIYKLTDKAVMMCLDEEYHAVKELTTAQYEALSTSQQNNGTIYIQTDAETTGSDIAVSDSDATSIAEAIQNPTAIVGTFTADANVTLLRSTLIKVNSIKFLSVIFNVKGTTDAIGTMSSGFEASHNYDFTIANDKGTATRARINQDNVLTFSTKPVQGSYYALTIVYI